MKAAIPIWIAFVPSSMAWGIAAQAHGLRLDEIILMSAWVYSGPAQFAVLEPLASGKSALQVLIASSLVNLRFLPMSTALAPFFGSVGRVERLLSCQFISASSFIVPYLHFQKEREGSARSGKENLHFFLGVGVTCFLVWVVGSASGYGVALGVPPGFNETLKFILPGYFAGLLVAEMRGWTMPLVCLGSLLVAVPATLFSSDWGWITTAALIAIVGWAFEQWVQRGSN